MSSENSTPLLLPWFALKVRSSGEARVKSFLDHKGYDIFLPTYVESRKYSDRIKKIDAPLFPGYLFCRLDVEKRLPVLKTPGVDSVIGVAGNPQPIDESEIDAIRRVVQSGASAIPWPYLRAGDIVEIQFGSLSGLRGILLNIRGKDRLILSVNLLQRSISVEIDRTWVRPHTTTRK